jgi:hypothetical protein
MNRMLLFVLLTTSAVPLGFAQDPVTIKADPKDLSRPVSTLLIQMRHHENISVSYEDPRYRNRDDMEGPNVVFKYSPPELEGPDGVDGRSNAARVRRVRWPDL